MYWRLKTHVNCLSKVRDEESDTPPILTSEVQWQSARRAGPHALRDLSSVRRSADNGSPEGRRQIGLRRPLRVRRLLPSVGFACHHSYHRSTRGPINIPISPGISIPAVYQLATNEAALSLQ
jgi:hypothetical protein